MAVVRFVVSLRRFVLRPFGKTQGRPEHVEGRQAEERPAKPRPAAYPPIPWHQRLEARVVFGVSVVAGLSLAAVLVATGRVVRTNALVRAKSEFEAARAAFYQSVDARAESAAARLRLIAELPVLRAHMTDIRVAQDAATLHEMAEAYRRDLDAAWLVVTDDHGAWIASPEWPGGAAAPSELQKGIEAGRMGRSNRAIVPVADHLDIAVTEPARFAEEVLGTLTIGYLLDDGVARELARATRCEVSVISGGRVTASSLPLAQRTSLASLLRSGASPLGHVGQPADLRPLGDVHYVSGTYPLQPNAGATSSGTLVLLQDWQPTQRFVDEIRTQEIWLGGVTFLFALVGGVVLSRRVTRPLREIATVALDIAAGHWDRRVPAHGHDEAAAMAAAFNDMTATLTHWHREARQRENELRQAQKMEAIGQLAGGVAHDFNNLLMAIHGYGELLLLDMPEEPEEPEKNERRDHVKQVLKAADSAGALTRQLLAFSRKQILTPKVVNLGAIVNGMEKMLRRLIGEHIDLVVKSGRDLWWVKADPGQLEQVIMNLAVNARDAMPKGGRLSITLENVHSAPLGALRDHSARGERSVSMTVNDTGCGMDAETLSRVFEPFFTTKEQGHGTGLGLAMVYGIIEQSGGSIAVDSYPNRGTSFRVLLPRAEEEPAADAEQEMPMALVGAEETILLVEDEPIVRDFVREVLEREGYRVIESTRGDDAFAVAARFPGRIHLLLTDVVMPGMSGPVLWDKLSASRRDINVLFMSGYSHEATVRHGIRDSGLPFLQKPFPLVELLREVHRALGREGVTGPIADRK